MYKNIKILLLLLLFTSCKETTNTNISRKQIDLFIETYQNVNFVKYQNKYIYIRQITPINIIYIIGEPSDKYMPFYSAKYNKILRKVTKINRTRLDEIKFPDYFTDKEIKDLVYDVNKFHFAYLMVDSLNNIFINPFMIMSPPLFLRNESLSKNNIVLQKDTFCYYKDNWYINIDLMNSVKW